MPETLLAELLKLSIPTALLGWISYTLWKRFDARVKQNETELKELRTRYDNEIFSTRDEIKQVLKENSVALVEMRKQSRASTSVMERCNNVMDCLTKEIKKVKPNFINPQNT